jgi:ATP-dependent protease HslVU (ClpYQ) peptidase subunit
MTVIAWDGKTLAADKRTTDAGVGLTTTKIFRAPCGALLGAGGTTSACHGLKNWWVAGADPEKFPEKDKDAALMVVKPGGKVLVYWESAVGVEIEDAFFAIGSGRDFALAAMHLGCSAKRAVEVACTFSPYCGNGIDTLELKQERTAT